MYRPALGERPGWIAEYTSSLRTVDPLIFEEVVLVASAHLIHLTELGLIPRSAASSCASALLKSLNAREEILSGEYDDVHESLEAWIVGEIGEEAAGWIGFGKSRNDQVAAAIRLAVRSRVLRALRQAARLREVLSSMGERFADWPMPAFTHLRHAQPTTLGHYALAVEESVSHHWRSMARALGEVDASPMGACAASGPSLPVDRRRVADLLGFRGVVGNTLYASGSRDFLLTSASPAAWLLVSLSRVAEDLIVWSTPNFGYLRVPPEHSASSSVMPQKVNPVTLEVVRARAGEAIGRLLAMAAVMKGLPSGYNLDLQELTLHSLWIMDEAARASAVMADLLARAEWDREALRRDAAGPGGEGLAQDLAEQAALRGVPFREAHRSVALGLSAGRGVGEVAADLGLPPPDLEGALRARTVEGGPNPREVLRAARAAEERLKKDERWLRAEEERVRSARERVLSLLRGLASGRG